MFMMNILAMASSKHKLHNKMIMMIRAEMKLCHSFSHRLRQNKLFSLLWWTILWNKEKLRKSRESLFWQMAFRLGFSLSSVGCGERRGNAGEKRKCVLVVKMWKCVQPRLAELLMKLRKMIKIWENENLLKLILSSRARSFLVIRSFCAYTKKKKRRHKNSSGKLTYLILFYRSRRMRRSTGKKFSSALIIHFFSSCYTSGIIHERHEFLHTLSANCQFVGWKGNFNF